jgi:Spy/CpxP family protein refolding chaperone
MGSFNFALLEALLSIGVTAERARTVVELFDRSIDERYSLHARILATKSDVAEINARIAETRGQLEARIAESRADVIRWTLAALTAQTALLLAAIKVF